MKKETIQNKLFDILGLTELKTDTKQPKHKAVNGTVSVTEDEIQEFRAKQGLIYFLQAPELFTAKVCPHCGEGFLVSRKYVKYCSYTCIEKSLEEIGIYYSRVKTDENGVKTYDIDESYIRNIWNGNEPIWVRNLATIQMMLDSVRQPAEA